MYNSKSKQIRQKQREVKDVKFKVRVSLWVLESDDNAVEYFSKYVNSLHGKRAQHTYIQRSPSSSPHLWTRWSRKGLQDYSFQWCGASRDPHPPQDILASTWAACLPPSRALSQFVYGWVALSFGIATWGMVDDDYVIMLVSGYRVRGLELFRLRFLPLQV